MYKSILKTKQERYIKQLKNKINTNYIVLYIQMQDEHLLVRKNRADRNVNLWYTNLKLKLWIGS